MTLTKTIALSQTSDLFGLLLWDWALAVTWPAESAVAISPERRPTPFTCSLSPSLVLRGSQLLISWMIMKTEGNWKSI